MAGLNKPNFLCRDVTEIPFDELSQAGVKVFVFDIDNTLVPQNRKKLGGSAVEALKKAQKYGKVVAATNNSRNREGMFPENVMIFQPRSFWHYLLFKKPYRRYFETLLKILGMPANQVAFIGDKYFFDINPAMRLGMVGVLVNPVGEDLWLDKIFRTRERENIILKNSFNLKRPS